MHPHRYFELLELDQILTNGLFRHTAELTQRRNLYTSILLQLFDNKLQSLS